MDLTEAEDIKKRWQEHTEELYESGKTVGNSEGQGSLVCCPWGREELDMA